MDELHIGRKILQYRKEKGLNIRQLAEMADVTPSLLSQIERGLANPSIQTLKMIAHVLDVQLFHFFLGQTSTEELIVKSDKRKKIIFPENELLSYELLSPDLSGAIEMALMKLMPGSHSSERPLQHKGEETSFILEGKVLLHMNGEVILLNQGDSVRIPSLAKHRWENPFHDRVVVVFAVSPPSF
ncbi:helix-turn-helix domain-containing protein [Brevibacillus sp. AY1]|uniref:helix-turn-helix domain-containing protein n=1 Tax=Brevibacillus sp. AY1 TaxID=2807621 RepID=UPI0024589BCA|nr:helix-turn-helix domain-containing protein [Brevibacillus sp. AY1]MDH4619243.1 helix-turn-helix domain-containing protein [Brevibacillus sp. AY1]